MNENIKQLQNTAGIQVVRTLMRGDENTEVKLMLTQTQLDKFDELIVGECVDIINHRADTSADYLDSNKANEHARQVQRDCATTIKQHFVVKE